MMPLPVPRDGSSVVGRAAQEASGTVAMPSATSAPARRMVLRAAVRGEVEAFMVRCLSRWSGQEEEAQHQVHLEEADDDTEELALGETLLGPTDVGCAHCPHAPQQQDGEDEAQDHGGDVNGREAAV